MLKFWNWSMDQWTFVIAVIALLQPLAIFLYKRIFKSGAVDIYETGALEIGYSSGGATIGVAGTLRAFDRDMFIVRSFLTLTTPGGGSPRKFECFVFRKSKSVLGQTGAALGQTGEVSVERPTSFMVSEAQPYPFDFLFYDVALNQELRPAIQNMIRAWQAMIQQDDEIVAAQQFAAMPQRPGTPDAQHTLATTINNAYLKFSGTPEYLGALAEVERVFYWTPGSYRLTFHIDTARPTRHHTESWSFTLPEDEVQIMRRNFTAILSEFCGLPIAPGHYHFIYPPYDQSRAE